MDDEDIDLGIDELPRRTEHKSCQHRTSHSHQPQITYLHVACRFPTKSFPAEKQNIQDKTLPRCYVDIDIWIDITRFCMVVRLGVMNCFFNRHTHKYVPYVPFQAQEQCKS